MNNTTSLNEKEQRVLEYIKKQIKDTGYPPSVREICSALGFKSTSSAHQYIWRLAEKGYIDKGDLKTRAIKVVGTESTIAVPIVGKVAAGEPILATENIEDYMSIGESFFSKDALQNEVFRKLVHSHYGVLELLHKICQMAWIVPDHRHKACRPENSGSRYNGYFYL